VVTQWHGMKRPTHVISVASHQFENRGRGGLGPHDFLRAVITHGELLHVTVLSSAPCVAVSHPDRGPPHVHWQGRTTASKYQGTRFRKAAREKDIGPTRGFAASPRMGPEAIIGTLETGYPRIHALRQDEGQDVRSHTPTCPGHRIMPPGTGNSGAATPPMASAPEPWLRAAPKQPRVPWLKLPAMGSG
jgi:hypothetical protein